jgi:tRNA(adenine34) deaminase
MGEALRAARAAGRAGEVPVGAVVFDRDGRRLASGSNRTLRDLDPSAHAEIVALRRAARRAGNHRLAGARVYCTLEPCPMCLGALVQARVAALVYAAADPNAGGLTLRVFPWRGANHRFEVRGGIREREAAAILRAFFQARRRPSGGGRRSSSGAAAVGGRRAGDASSPLRRAGRKERAG